MDASISHSQHSSDLLRTLLDQEPLLTLKSNALKLFIP